MFCIDIFKILVKNDVTAIDAEDEVKGMVRCSSKFLKGSV